MPPTTQTPTPWDRWQASTVSVRYLSPEARQQGYTVLQVHPHSQETFLALEGFLRLYGPLVARRSCPPLVRVLGQAWLTWTLRLTAYFRRLQAGQEGTCPPCPCRQEAAR